MGSRRRFLGKMASVSVIGGLAGCSEAVENANTGRGELLDGSESTGLEIPGGQAYLLSQAGSHFLEMEYSVNIQKPESGFEDSGSVDIIVLSENAYREVDMDEGISQEFLDNPNSGDIESLSQLDVDGEVEESGQLEAGIYHFIVDNTASDRPIEADISVDTYEYNRDMDVSSCNNESSGLDIKTLAVYNDEGLIAEEIVARFNIAVNDTTGDEYSLSMDLLTDRDETNISMTQERDICSTHFVGVKELDDLDVNDGWFETDEEMRANITIEKDGESYAEEEVSFTAGSGY